jgi:hypothetical protein
VPDGIRKQLLKEGNHFVNISILAQLACKNKLAQKRAEDACTGLRSGAR